MSVWSECRIKDICDIYPGATPSSNNERFWDGPINWIGPADMCDFGTISTGARTISKEGYNSCGTHLVPLGTVILSTRAPIGKVNIATQTLCTNQGCKSLIPKNISSSFLAYYLHNKKEELDSLGSGTTFKELSLKTLSNYCVCFPNKETQEHIIDYLDNKTGEINSRLSILQKKSDCYFRLKSSFINRAVTRGLNPAVSFKDSGIEWIGEIPEHWEIKRISDTASSEVNSFMDGDWIESPYIIDDGIRYLTSGNVGSLKYKEQGAGYISEATFKALQCSEVFPGDLLISRLNPPIGRTCMVPDLGKRIITCVDNVIYRPDKELYDRQFLVYLMNCSMYAQYVTMLGRGATMQRLSRSILAKIKIPIPPLSEQQAIATYLDEKCAKIDAAVANIEKQIDAMKRLKRALINEVVTGKREV